MRPATARIERSGTEPVHINKRGGTTGVRPPADGFTNRSLVACATVPMDLLAAEVDVVTAAWAADHGEKGLNGQIRKERPR